MYRQFLGLDSRRLVWFLAQMHLFFGAFVLGVPLFAVIVEIVGWRKKDGRFDKLAYEFISLPSVAYATTAAFGGRPAFALFTLYPTFMGYMTLEIDPPLPVTLAQGYEAGGCLAGTRYCRVTPEGELTPCPYMEVSAGSLRETDFAMLWRNAPLFARLRAPKLEGRCGACEYAKLCGGCRVRPLARDGNLTVEDFLCSYQPGGGATIEPLFGATSGSFPWTSEAEVRLARAPSFVRRFVHRRAEDHAREIGARSVTAEHRGTLARRRFAGKGPPLGFAAQREGREP